MDLWLAEAGKYNVLPLNDHAVNGLGIIEIRRSAIPVAAERPVHLLPGHVRGARALAANTHGGSYKVLAEVEFTDDDARA